MKKKVLLSLMGAVLVAGLMAGCGSSNESGKDSAKTESVAETEADKKADDKTEANDDEDADADDAETDDAETDDADKDDEEADDEDSGEGDKAHVARTNSNYGDTVSAAGWNITVEDVEINDSLENVSVDLGYTGVETSDYKKEADSGKTFCLIKLKIEKDGSKESLDWANLKLTDSEGNEYTRTDDEFITELGMTRMAGTTLNFGSNEGWIAFEINENAEGLELSYPFEAEAYNCAL